MQLAAFLVPEPKKMRIGLEKLIETVVQRSVYPTDEEKNPFLELREEQDCFIIIYRNYWESKNVVSQSPVCGIFVGILDALMEWITGVLARGRRDRMQGHGVPV